MFIKILMLCIDIKFLLNQNYLYCINNCFYIVTVKNIIMIYYYTRNNNLHNILKKCILIKQIYFTKQNLNFM